MSLHPDRSRLDKTAVENFRTYLRIPTVHPNVNYDEAVVFLKDQAVTLNLPVQVYNVGPKNPVVIITWKGTEPTLPSILLNSHMDVVPVFADQWTYPPFGAEIDEKGNIYARGSQDMNCVGIQYLEAIRRMRFNGKNVKRTIHVSFVPDEEIGDGLGLNKFVLTNEFKALNVGFTLDEGLASPTESYNLYYGARVAKTIRVQCPGNTGHGSLLLNGTAGEKLRVVIEKFMDYRAEQKARLSDPSVKLGDVNSVNLTMIQGGVQMNVLPSSLAVTFDCRLNPKVSYDEFKDLLNKWCEEAGESVHYTEDENELVDVTKLDDSNPYWLAFKRACDREKMNLDVGIFPAASDGYYVRALGIPVLNFSPMNNTKVLLHDHNECLNVNVFLRGIAIYESIIEEVANI